MWNYWWNWQLEHLCLLQVDAMKIGVKDFKKAYKHINIDQIEVSVSSFVCWAPSAFGYHVIFYSS